MRAKPGVERQQTLAMDLPCACATARQLARVLTLLYDSHLKKIDLEAPQFALLMIFEKRGTCGPIDMGRSYALDKTTISRNLKVLERKGWIEASEANDRRRHEFKLTDAGRRRLAEAKPQWLKAQSELRAAMTGEKWDEMFGVLRDAIRTAQKIHDDRSHKKGNL